MSTFGISFMSTFDINVKKIIIGQYINIAKYFQED